MTRTENTAEKALISHPAHPQHQLQLVVATEKFQCNGCKQRGAGQSYRCEPCDYDLHTVCVPPETPLKHPRFNGCELCFRLEPPGPGRSCDACGDVVLGFVYFNRERDIDLHPACAFHPQLVEIDGTLFELHTEKDAALVCRRCKVKDARRNSYWSYRSRDRREDGELAYLHVGCMIDGEGSASEAQSVPTELLNAPGQMTWYKSIWKLTKIVAKLAYYLLSFDGTGITSMAGAVADYFSK
ncbi:hypothetical protein CFC21_106256 [Triticum aestivum]|uniref:DC1 domain-containing protein n=2 Tax=Triticum aestivum TaxID=4565 RepID=A0A3B6U7U6_WHEAT|nr:uncharacterized protein LOC123175974 [Triticum aestivum]KAF7105443.1 hypothetical protein CFC21_106256 [Triticum aestivum]